MQVDDAIADSVCCLLLQSSTCPAPASAVKLPRTMSTALLAVVRETYETVEMEEDVITVTLASGKTAKINVQELVRPCGGPHSLTRC